MTAKISPLQLRLVSVWMLPPDYIGIRNFLEDRGYTTRGFELLPPPLILGEKGFVRVYSDIERRTLGVRGQMSPTDLVEAYSELMQVNLKDLGVNPDNIMFHEFAGDYSAITGRNPLEVMRKFGDQTDFLSKIQTKSGLDLAQISIGLGLRRTIPTSKEWGHFSIEPAYPSSNSRYHISIVYRNNLEDVLAFVKGIESTIRNILQELERR